MRILLEAVGLGMLGGIVAVAIIWIVLIINPRGEIKDDSDK